MLVPPSLIERWCKSVSTSATCLSLNVRALTSCKLDGISLHKAEVVIHLELRMNVPVNEPLSVYKVSSIPTYLGSSKMTVNAEIKRGRNDSNVEKESEKDRLAKKLVNKLLEDSKRKRREVHDIFRTREIVLPRIIATNKEISLKSDDTKVLVFNSCTKSGQLNICKIEEASANKNCAKAIIGATSANREQAIVGQCQVVKSTTSMPCEVIALNNGYLVSTMEPIQIIGDTTSNKESIFEADKDTDMCQGACVVLGKEQEQLFYCRKQRYVVKHTSEEYTVEVQTRKVSIDLSNLKDINEHDLSFQPLGIDLIDQHINMNTVKNFFYRLFTVSSFLINVSIVVFIITRIISRSHRCRPLKRCLTKRKIHLKPINEEGAILTTKQR